MNPYIISHQIRLKFAVWRLRLRGFFMKVGRVDAAHGWFSAIWESKKKKKCGEMATTRGLLLSCE